jgi:predicted nucleotidyltransferase
MTTTAAGAATYSLPFGDVFRTKHSGERNHRTAQRNLILLSEVGSRLHGTNIGGDDQDLKGVFIDPPEVMVGTRDIALYEYRTVAVGVPSGENDIDLSVFGLAKWIRLILNGNPTDLLPLFAPADRVYYINWAGRELRDNVHLFLAKDHAKKFLGYLNSQRQHLTGVTAPRVNRPTLVAQYGFDVKYASTALRIAIQGSQLMRNGALQLPMAAHERRYLIDVRQGRYTLSEVLKKLGDLEAELMDVATYSTVLPAKIDYDYVDNWLVDIYQRWWAGERGL